MTVQISFSPVNFHKLHETENWYIYLKKTGMVGGCYNIWGNLLSSYFNMFTMVLTLKQQSFLLSMVSYMAARLEHPIHFHFFFFAEIN